MPDDRTDLLRWVAEELLGWTYLDDRDELARRGLIGAAWRDREMRLMDLDELESWHGIGLVFGAMKQQPSERLAEFEDELCELPVAWWAQDEPCIPVFAAARRACGEKK